MSISSYFSACRSKPGIKVSSKILTLAAFVFGSLQMASAVSPPGLDIPYVVGDTIFWSNPNWHQVQSRQTGEFVCQGGTSCRVVNGPYWVTEHLADGSGSGWLLEVVEGEEGVIPQLTAETFADAVTVDGNTIRWPQGGWYQVQDTETYTEQCFGNINFCRLASPGQYKVTNHSLGLNTFVYLGQDEMSPQVAPFELDFSGVLPEISWPADGWYQIQTSGTYETVCEGGAACFLPRGSYNIINHTSGERWNEFLVGVDTPYVINPQALSLTRAECVTIGGSVIGDIGDGSIFRPAYRCASGAAPIASITYLEAESIAVEGGVCCL